MGYRDRVPPQIHSRILPLRLLRRPLLRRGLYRRSLRTPQHRERQLFQLLRRQPLLPHHRQQWRQRLLTLPPQRQQELRHAEGELCVWHHELHLLRHHGVFAAVHASE